MPDGNDRPRFLVRVSRAEVRLGGRTILAGVDLVIRPGEIVSLIGPNGAGKTTLVRLVLGLLRPNAGEVWRAACRVGYAPQRFAVDPTLPLTVGRFLKMAGGDEESVRAALAETGVAGLWGAAVQEISAGELRRVLLARALVRAPELLVLDEPDQGVDIGGQVELYALIDRIRDRRGCGVLLVSHDLHLVMAATDRVVCLNRHVCCEGRPETVSRDPAYVALFGTRAAEALAVYHHRHDHRHGADGAVLPIADAPAAKAADGHG